MIVSASCDGSIRVFEVESGECVNVLRGHESIVMSAVFNYNDTMIVSASCDGTIRIWDVESGECLNIFEGTYNKKVEFKIKRLINKIV